MWTDFKPVPFPKYEINYLDLELLDRGVLKRLSRQKLSVIEWKVRGAQLSFTELFVHRTLQSSQHILTIWTRISFHCVQWYHSLPLSIFRARVFHSRINILLLVSLKTSLFCKRFPEIDLVNMLLCSRLPFSTTLTHKSRSRPHKTRSCYFMKWLFMMSENTERVQFLRANETVVNVVQYCTTLCCYDCAE